MPAYDAAAFSATPALAAEVPIADNTRQATTPMSMAYVLNPANPRTGMQSHGSSSSSTAPATPADDSDDAKTLVSEDRATSPAPSTGDAPDPNAAVSKGAAGPACDVEAETNAGAADGTTTETFRCMNDEFEECRTGQTTVDLSRKVISDHFGRNKACTRMITDWPLFCRKHYQRATYNQKLWQARKITLILRQFNIIEAQFPGTKYTVALKKSEEQRLNTFSRKVASGRTEAEAAELVAPEKGKHFEAPVNVLREIEQLNYLGEDKTKADVEGAVNTIRDMLENEDTEQVPSIEFLPQLDADGNPYDADNRGKTPKKSAATASKSRVSKKGAITKPSPKEKTPKKATKA